MYNKHSTKDTTLKHCIRYTILKTPYLNKRHKTK